MRAVHLLHVRSSELAATLAGLVMAIVAATYVAEIAARYFFNAPLNFSAEMGSYGLCVSVFLCLPAITMERRHIAIGFLAAQMPAIWQNRWSRLLLIVSAIVLFAIGYFTVLETIRQFKQNALTPMALQIPRWWLTSIACYGLISAAIHFVTPPSREWEGIGE